MLIRSIRDVAAAVRGARRDAGLSQGDLAARAGVSRKWIYEFEAGKPSVELGLVLRVVDALGLQLEVRPVTQPSPAGRRSVDLDGLLDGLRSNEPGS